METCESLLKKALVLRPQDRFLLIDGLVRSLDEPNKEITAIWADEAENGCQPLAIRCYVKNFL